MTGYEAGDIAITAAEGGIGYWAQIDLYQPDRWDGIDVPDDFLFYRVREQEGDWYGEWQDVRVSTIRRGVTLFQEGGPFYEPDDLGVMDASEADAVIQYGLRGKVVFS